MQNNIKSTLIDEMKDSFIMMERTREPDGEGGFITRWRDGAEFDAVLTFNSTINAKVAYKQGVTSLYTLTCDKSIPLEFHDVIKRVEDGEVFRITSDESKKTPKIASFEFQQLDAEKWKLQE